VENFSSEKNVIPSALIFRVIEFKGTSLLHLCRLNPRQYVFDTTKNIFKYMKEHAIPKVRKA
jgi:hypothetical protein